MTNTIFFYDTIRDDESVVSATSEEEETPPTSNRYTHQQGSSSVNPGGIFEYSNLKEFWMDEGSLIEYITLEEGTFGSLYNGWVDELELDDYYRRDMILGQGSFGSVFKGWIDANKLTATKTGKGIPVAIKILKIPRKYQAEVNCLGRLDHPNLLRLLGYCSLNKEPPLVYGFIPEGLLVYEFMPQGSLADRLYENVSTPLSWSVRMKIALGAAKGLAFLHSAPINVIHRNFKSSIILLDMDYNAKLSGFRLSMDGPTGDESHVSTEIMGTNVYAVPEYIATGQLIAKCDVYAFGVVLLEMLSGRRVIDPKRPSGKRSLVDWAKTYLNHKRKVYRVADSRLEGQYSLEGFQKAANLALICLSQNGKSRPNMDEVVKVLGEL